MKPNTTKYVRLHEWVRENKPKPKFCEECKIKEPYDVANISGWYKKNINDYKWLCRSCHNTNDRQNGIHKENSIRDFIWSITERQSPKASETECWYCGNIIDLIKTNKHHFCCVECRLKYYKGVAKNLWKRGDMRVNIDDKPRDSKSFFKNCKGVKRK